MSFQSLAHTCCPPLLCKHPVTRLSGSHKTEECCSVWTCLGFGGGWRRDSPVRYSRLPVLSLSQPAVSSSLLCFLLRVWILCQTSLGAFHSEMLREFSSPLAEIYICTFVPNLEHQTQYWLRMFEFAVVQQTSMSFDSQNNTDTNQFAQSCSGFSPLMSSFHGH